MGGFGPPDTLGLRSSAGIQTTLRGLSQEQVQALIAVLIDAWDPDEGIRTDYLADGKRIARYARGLGWSSD